MLSVLAVLLCGFAFAQAEPLRVTVVLSETGGSYQAYAESLRERIESSGVQIGFSRAGERPAGSDLYIAVGMKATAELAGQDLPVLSVFVPKSGFERLQRESAKRAAPFSAIYLDQPVERQVALLQAVIPDARHVGVLYSSPPPELPAVRSLLDEAGLVLHERKYNQARPLNDELENVLENSEVLMVLPDAVVYNPGTIRNILLTAYRRQIPLVGISQAYVKAGALCAVFSTPEQIAEQSAAAIRRFAASARLPAAQYPSAFEIAVNMQVARSLDLHIKDVAHLRAVIGDAP